MKYEDVRFFNIYFFYTFTYFALFLLVYSNIMIFIFKLFSSNDCNAVDWIQLILIISILTDPKININLGNYGSKDEDKTMLLILNKRLIFISKIIDNYPQKLTLYYIRHTLVLINWQKLQICKAILKRTKM